MPDITDEQLAKMAWWHTSDVPPHYCLAGCKPPRPCDAALLVGELRRRRREMDEMNDPLPRFNRENEDEQD